jgi:hypothetical protein
MNYQSLRAFLIRKKLGVLLVAGMFLWFIGFPTFHNETLAAAMTFVSDTASSTAPSANSNHLIRWTSAAAVTAGQTIILTYNPGDIGGNFDFGSLVAGDISATGATVVADLGSCPGSGDNVYPTISNAAGTRGVTFTVCPSNTVGAGAKVISFTNNHVTNPASAGSYYVRITGTQTDSGSTLLAIISRVTLTASVDTSFSFSIAGVATGQTVNGTTTSTTTTSTAIEFGTLASGTPVVAAQDLTVITNSPLGFAVTVHQDQNLTSSNGADIDTFKDGLNTATPITWVAPSSLVADERTFGHFGVTSDDTDLNGGEFTGGGGNKWAGNFFSTTTRIIFSHNGPADGLTQDKGKVRVGYEVQITSLQEAATDYSNHLIYVATPVF